MLGKHSRVVLGVLAFTLLLGLGGWWAAGREAAAQGDGATTPVTAPAPVTAAPMAESKPSPPVKASNGTRAWVPGTLYRYTLKSNQQVLFRQTRSDAPPPPGMQFSIQGEWRVGIVSARAERIEAMVQLQPSSFSMSVGGESAIQPEVQRTMTMALGKPFFITLDPSGAAKFVHFEQQTDMLVQGLLRSLVAATQFVVAGKPADAWDMTEYDSTGEYTAAYRRQAANRFEKTKRAYARVTTPQGLVPLEKGMSLSVQSTSGFELAEDLWAQSLKIQESLELNAGEGMPVTTNTLQLTLGLIERRMDASLLGALSARQGSLMTLPLASFLGQQDDPLNHHRQTLGGRRFDDMVRDLRALPKGDKERDDARTLAMERLRSLFLLEPAEALKVHDILRSGLDPLAASPMLGALSGASTPEALQSLVNVIDDKSLAPIVRTDAVAALGMAQEPTREGVDGLRRYTQDSEPMVRDTATLAMGSASSMMRDTDPRGADSLVSEMQNAYRSAQTPEQQALVLRSLGNTRAAGALPTIEQGLQSSIAMVREAAVVALRNMPGPTVDRLLSERLVGDPAPEVRKSAVFACSFRPLAPFLSVFQTALQVDAAMAVRSDIVSLLGHNRAALPLVDPLLVWASRNDTSPDIRKAALDYLNPSARPAPVTP